MTDARFSRIVIIQSLPFGESPTGRQLRDGIEPTAKFSHDISVEFIEARTAKDFWRALDSIQATTEQNNDYPVLHFECHGLNDRTGLSLGDGTALSWGELKIALVRLNQATRCNLLVTLAACHGATMLKTLNVSSRAPCCVLMGPSGEVSPPDLVSSYSTFFLKLLEVKDIWVALSSLRESQESKATYFLFTAEDIFQQVFSLYRLTCSTNTQMTERAERLSQIFRKHGMLGVDSSFLNNRLHEAELDILIRFYRNFFFVDFFPGNELRFANAYSAIRR
jgi:hypothetical protein